MTPYAARVVSVTPGRARAKRAERNITPADIKKLRLAQLFEKALTESFASSNP